MQIRTRSKWFIFRRYIMAKKLKLFSERISKIFIFLGLGLLMGIVILYWYNDHNFDSNYQINDNKLGSFGDIIGGLIGSIWALAGYILYYVALKEQRKDIETNQRGLNVQIATLERQVQEYELQRQELVETRKVLNQQSITLLKQQFESTFFNSLNLLNNIIDKFIIIIPSVRTEYDAEKNINRPKNYNINLIGKDVFINYLEKLKEAYSQYCADNEESNFLQALDALDGDINKNDFEKEKIIVKRVASKYYDEYQKELGHYFRTVNNIVKLIARDSTKISGFQFYNELFTDQFSSEELVLLFYYFIVIEEKQFTKDYIEKNYFFRNINSDLLLKVSHKSLYKDRAYDS